MSPRALALALMLAASAACVSDADTSLGAPPTPEADRHAVRASLQEALSRDPAHLRTRVHPDGGTHTQIVGGFQHHTLLVRGDAGVERHCSADLAEALRLIEGVKK